MNTYHIKLPLYQRMLFGLATVAIIAGLIGYYLSRSFVQQTLEEYAGKISVDITSLTLETFDQKLDEKIFFWETYFHTKSILEAIKASNAQFETIPDKQAVIAQRDKLWIDGKVNETNADWFRVIALAPQSIALRDFAGTNNYYDQEHFGISEIFFLQRIRRNGIYERPDDRLQPGG